MYYYENSDEKNKNNKTFVKDTLNSVDNSNQEELRKIDYNMTYELTYYKNSWKDLLKEEMILSTPTKQRRRRRIHCPSLRIFLKYYMFKNTFICIPFKNTFLEKSKRK